MNYFGLKHQDDPIILPFNLSFFIKANNRLLTCVGLPPIFSAIADVGIQASLRHSSTAFIICSSEYFSSNVIRYPKRNNIFSYMSFVLYLVHKTKDKLFILCSMYSTYRGD